MKKSLLQVLVLMLCVSLLIAGCQNTGNGTTSTGNPSATQKPTTAPTEKPAEYTGGAITSFPYTGDPITIVYSSCIESVSKCYADNMECAVYQAFKEKIGNINFEYVFNGDDEAMRVMLSTGDMPFDVFDFWDCPNVGRDYGLVGSLLELSQYADIMPNLMATVDLYPQFCSGLTDDGRFFGYGIMMNQETEWFFPHYGWRFNGYYLSALNAQVPATIDEFYEYCKAVKEFNPGCYPFMMTYDAYLSTFLGMYGVVNGFYYDVNQDSWIYGLTEYPDKFYDGLALMNKFYTEKLILQDFMTISQEQVAALMGSIDGFAASPWSVAGINAEEQYIAERKAQDPTYDLVFSPSIRAEGVPYRPSPMQWAGQSSWFGIFVNAKTEDPAMICSVLDFLYSDDIKTLNFYGIEGVTFEYENGQPMFLNSITTSANPDGTVDAHDLCGLCSLIDQSMGLVGMCCGRPPVGWHWNVYLNDYSKTLVQPQIEAANENIPLDERHAFSSADLAISDAENERIAAVQSPLQTFVSAELIKFAVGERSLNEWDAFLQQVAQYDVQSCLDIYNSKELPY